MTLPASITIDTPGRGNHKGIRHCYNETIPEGEADLAKNSEQYKNE